MALVDFVSLLLIRFTLSHFTLGKYMAVSVSDAILFHYSGSCAALPPTPRPRTDLCRGSLLWC